MQSLMLLCSRGTCDTLYVGCFRTYFNVVYFFSRCYLEKGWMHRISLSIPKYGNLYRASSSLVSLQFTPLTISRKAPVPQGKVPSFKYYWEPPCRRSPSTHASLHEPTSLSNPDESSDNSLLDSKQVKQFTLPLLFFLS